MIGRRAQVLALAIAEYPSTVRAQQQHQATTIPALREDLIASLRVLTQAERELIVEAVEAIDGDPLRNDDG